ncbi:proteoglycan Cow [Phlebotomus argentipes]|uniref:proteoglycan Cow n=1 Tax=Phlebotomus argentipes TaxID=94469 RepID=UPI002892A960|nr:proteoglycan Cow [Phlebotomus argentipes]
MKCLWVSVAICLVLAVAVSAKKKNKYDGDFEFVDEDDKSSLQKPTPEKKKWIHDPSSDLCRPLNCKKKELCLLEDAYTAVCVSKKELHRNRDEIITKAKLSGDDDTKRKLDLDMDELQDQDDPEEDSSQDDDVFYDTTTGDRDEENCKLCPVTKPTFMCGSDNRTYSSLCRLDYHNCIHATAIKVACKGFCPCRDTNDIKKQQRLLDRQNALNAKYKMTVEGNGDDSDTKKYKEDKNRHFNHINSQFTFTPEDIKYDNKHYKYLKYSASSYKGGKEKDSYNRMDEKHKYRTYNEVIDKSGSKLSKNSNSIRYPSKSGECKPQQLTAIGNRLLDWFSVIMADSKKRRQHSQKSKAHFPPACKTEAKWMFGHLDLNNDGQLTTQELYDLEHDQNERCIKPFIDTCDLDQDSAINPREWCRCFEKTDRPCAAVRRRIGGDLLGAYAPDCDVQGFYKPTQCHNSVGVCWCVDKHGVEFANTRTRGKPNCEDVINSAASLTSDDEDDEDDDDSSEGSADRLLVF